MGLELLQALDERRALIVTELFEQRGDPLPGFGRALAVKLAGDGPEMFLAVMEAEALAGWGKRSTTAFQIQSAPRLP